MSEGEKDGMTIGFLFSGIGGLELGLEWAGLGPVKWQVEIDEKCRNCLATHWPEAKRFEDVCKVGRNELEPVEVICGGFPCQDISSAGKRAGLDGARSGLWFQFARIVGELKPKYVVVENVLSGASKWVDAVREELAQSGYESLPVPLAASDCGAWHTRRRVFVVAYLNSEPLRIERRGGYGQDRENQNEPEADSSDADGQGELQPSGIKRDIGRWSCDSDRIWSAEPDVARMVHGLPGRVDRERALGNSVVPQCAEVIGEVIKLLSVG